MTRRPCTQSGFTLIELMAVVTVATILALVAAPAFTDLIASTRARSAASALQDSLWLARSEAIKRNRSVGFTLASIEDGWTITLVDDPDTVLLQQGGFSGLQVSISGDAESVEFEYNSQGRLVNGVAAVKLTVSGTDGSGSRCIKFDAAARPKMLRGACT